MKRLTALATTLFLTACSTAPMIVPDTTSDSVILKKINYEIEKGKVFETGWQWILWYLPVLFLVVTWGWRQFVRPCPQCEEREDGEETVLLNEQKKTEQSQ